MTQAFASLSGSCLCGGVSVTLAPEHGELHVCHCDMCRRWTGSMMMVIDAAKGSVHFDGPVQTYKSSDWAERSFCGTCGSTLWYKLTIPGHESYHVAAGLFDDMGGFALQKEIYIDRKPAGFDLAGAHDRLTKQEVEATFASYVEGDQT
jgi:hypothetical protein